MSARIQSSEGCQKEGVVEQQNSRQLSMVRQMVALSRSEMIELVEDEQRFIAKIVELNKLGIESVTAQNYQVALFQLQQAEKVLEYAASCGKTIDRFLIISTLHNEAAIYHKLQEFQKSYDYMEAILYNMNTYLQHNYNLTITLQTIKPQSVQFKQASSLIYRKLSTAIYSLQYAAVASQVEKHNIAIKSAKRSLALLCEYSIQLLQYCKLVKAEESKTELLATLNRYCQGIEKSILPNLIKINKQMVFSLRNKQVQINSNLQRLKKFTIGQVMQMSLISVVKANQYQTLQQLTTKTYLYRVSLYASVAFYTIATQMRLSAKKHREHQWSTKLMKKSKIFHLYAIKIAFQLAPFLTDYHQHIIKSLKTHYQIDLNEIALDNTQFRLEDHFLDTQSFFIINCKESPQKIQKQTLQIEKVTQTQNKSIKPRKISIQSSSSDKKANNTAHNDHKKKLGGLQLKFKQSPKKSLGRKSHDKKLNNVNSEKKLNFIGKSGNIFFSKPLNKGEKHRTSNSNQKTKDETNKMQRSKSKKKKRIMQQYMPFINQGEAKKIIQNNKKEKKNVVTSQSKSKSKNKSKNKSKIKISLQSPKQQVNNIKSSKHKKQVNKI